MKRHLCIWLTGSALFVSAAVFGQASLKPNEFEAVKTLGVVNITNTDSAKADTVKIGSVYQMGDIKNVDPEAWAKGAGSGVGKPTTFKVVGIKGTCHVHAAFHIGYQTPTVGAVYPVGSSVKTERDSFLDIEISPRNTIRILPLTEAEIGAKTHNPGIVAVRLDRGTTDVKLESFPKDCRFEVATPMAVCGAVGTAFRTLYDINTNNAMVFETEVTDGQVTVFGRLIRIIDTPLHAGQALRIELTDDQNSRIVTARFTGQVGDVLKLLLWGREFHLQIAAPAGVDPHSVTQAFAEITLRMTRQDLLIPPIIPPIQDYPTSPAGT